MKKKITLLTLMLALFVCVFAISVNAASSNEFGEVEILSGMSEKSSFGTDGTEAGYTSRVVLYDGTEYHTYPAYYILTNSKTPSLTFDEIRYVLNFQAVRGINLFNLMETSYAQNGAYTLVERPVFSENKPGFKNLNNFSAVFIEWPAEVTPLLFCKSVENDIAIESKKLQVEIAKKELEGQKSLLEKGGATELDVNNAENTYLNAQTSLENAEISLSKMSIIAPFKGVITSLPYYTQGINVTSGTAMVQLMDFSTMYLEAQFPESNMESLTVGQNVYVTNYNIKSDTLHAELTQLSPAIDETTRTFKGFIKIYNPELLLRPGMFAKADIIAKRSENVVAIRKDIITKRGGRQIIYTVERTNAVENVIETGISDDRWVEVTKGLTEGDKIVNRGFEWLRNRSKVKVMQ